MKRSMFLIVFTVFLLGCSFEGGKIDTGNNNFDFDDQFLDNETDEPDKEFKPDADVHSGDDADQYDVEIDEDEAGDSDDDKMSIPDDDKIIPESVVIATYNARLFFDTVCDSGYCTSSDFEQQLSLSEYNEKVSDVADAVIKINADIVLLQEIEKKVCLEDLMDELDGRYESFYIGETGYDASIDTAVITKGIITYMNKHTSPIPHPDGGTTTFTRAFLEVHIDYQGRKIIAFSAHFKSKSSDDPERRQAEADAALEIIKDAAQNNPDALIVMGGDLNDTPGSGPVSTLENSPELTRVAAELSPTDQATYYYDGPIAIDHIFFSDEGTGSYIFGSAEVVKDSPSWYSLISSDHAALKAAFEF